MQHRIIVKLGGGIQFIYHDRLRPLLDLGASKIRRVSHVEPAIPTIDGTTSTVTKSFAGWTADMTPVGGPILGPFEERSTALAAEVEWLHAHPETWA